MTDSKPAAFRIKRFAVVGLFGTFDHAVDLKLQDRVTIIHGPNGFGKTVLLQMLQALLQNRFSRLRRTPFASFTVTLTTGEEVTVTRQPSNGGESDGSRPTLTFHLSQSGQQQDTYVHHPSREEYNFPLEYIERHVPELDRVDAEHWLHTTTGRVFTIDDVIEEYADLLAIQRVASKELPPWLSRLAQEADVRLIEAHRLYAFANTRRSRFPDRRGAWLQPAVSYYSQDLAQLIQSKQSEYGKRSQKLDSSFPARVLQPERQLTLNLADLRQRLDDLENKRQRIVGAGLLAQEVSHRPLVQPQVDETTKSILSLYVEDIEDKLSVFEDVTQRVELLKKSINDRFSYKSLEIDIKYGFRFLSSAGKPLQPTDLSSGEQHELVLLYELLFKTRENALILIDEPELSLHVAWQVQFLEDLAAAAKLSAFDVVLATHSPQIINDRWNLTVELKGPAV